MTGKIAGAEDGTALDVGLNGDQVLRSGGPFSAAPLDLGNLEVEVRGPARSDRSSLAVPKWSPPIAGSRGLAGSFEAHGLNDPHPAMSRRARGTLEADLLLAVVQPDLAEGPIGRDPITAEATGNDAAWYVTVTKLDVAGVTGDGSRRRSRTPTCRRAPARSRQVTGPSTASSALLERDAAERLGSDPARPERNARRARPRST